MKIVYLTQEELAVGMVEIMTWDEHHSRNKLFGQRRLCFPLQREGSLG
jgi:hypothetical protein